jgi:NTP pyrophosphatase (non-canonical NTP hydrolase)
MDMASYQRWFEEYDHTRSLDLVDVSQTTVHLMEEVGEIAREVLYLEGYRDPNARQDPVAKLSAEIGDALVFLTKLAIHYSIDMDTVLTNVVAKAESRWPLEKAQREMERYIEQQHAANVERTAAWCERESGSTTGVK